MTTPVATPASASASFAAAPPPPPPPLPTTATDRRQHALKQRYTGHIELICGPMMSGKTSELLRRIRRYAIAQRNCLLIKHVKDDRYATIADETRLIYTHDRQMMMAHPLARLADADALVTAYECIGVDEGQFFPDLAERAEAWANMGKVVVIAALDGTYRREPFGDHVARLFPLAESVVKLTAVCMCCGSERAAFTRRTSDETEVEVVGGSDKYVAVCRPCYFGARPATAQSPLGRPSTVSQPTRSSTPSRACSTAARCPLVSRRDSVDDADSGHAACGGGHGHLPSSLSSSSSPLAITFHQ